MKRLTSLDFLRGLAIIFMVAVHIVLAVWYVIGNADLGAFDAWMLPIVGVIIIVVHWRGVFIMISGIVTYYRMAAALKRGQDRRRILLNELFYGFLVLIIAKIYDTFFTTWGVFDSLTRGEGWISEDLNFVYFVEALDVIAFGIIFSAILFYFLDAMKDPRNKALFYFILAIVIFLISPLVQDLVNSLALWPEGVPADATLQTSDKFKDEVVSPIRRIILVWLGGREAPLFPMLGITFVASAIGVIISQDEPKIKHIRYANLGGLVLFLIGVVVLVLQILGGTFEFDPGFHVHPTWFIFINTAFQGWVMVWIIKKVEFNPKLDEEKWLKYSLPVRRWGMVALTIFIFQWWDVITRASYGAIFNLDVTERYQLNKWWTLAMSITSVLVWQLIIWLWEKAHFFGTWEVSLRWVRGLVTGQKVPLRDPLRLQDKLYNVEMIRFVEKE